MENEEWKDVVGFEGYYQVSNKGNVKSLERKYWNKHNQSFATLKEHILKPQNQRGYLRVMLSKNGKEKWYFIHRLAAAAFIPNPYNLPEVNHKDENPSNNMVDNLEWCDRTYNNNYGSRIERFRKKMINRPTKSKKVLCVETGITYTSTKEIHQLFGYSQGNISSCCTGRYETRYGYHWKYVE